MVACARLLFPIKNSIEESSYGIAKPLVASFIVNALVCAVIELVLGLTSNMPDANGVYPLWDYSTMPFNFMGQICLQNTLLFGVVATLMTWVVYPALQREYLKLPEPMRQTFFVAVLVFYTPSWSACTSSISRCRCKRESCNPSRAMGRA
ncbi:MAG: putative ABC transporter permease [Adlercreutzia equolifaciens]